MDVTISQRELKRFSAAPHKIQQVKQRNNEQLRASEYATKEKVKPQGELAKNWFHIKSYFETYKRHIFWCSLYTFVTLGIFFERFYCKYTFKIDEKGRKNK